MDNLLPVRLTLVSASPRRHELLAKLDLPFDVVPSSADELTTAASGRELSILNARLKVERSSCAEDRSRVLIGADTVVALDGRFFGKAEDADDARRILQELSGQTHDVITGVCISGPAPGPDLSFVRVEFADVSRVQFHDLTDDIIESYLRSGEWEGKAGAYAIQGAGGRLVSGLEGDLDNVIGLPTTLINDLLRSHFGHCRFL